MLSLIFNRNDVILLVKNYYIQLEICKINELAATRLLITFYQVKSQESISAAKNKLTRDRNEAV